MKTWVTSTAARQCGGHFAHNVAIGDIYLKIEVGTVKRVRCKVCAEAYFGMTAPQEAPPDVVVPVLKVQAPPEPFDYKVAAGGRDGD